MPFVTWANSETDVTNAEMRAWLAECPDTMYYGGMRSAMLLGTPSDYWTGHIHNRERAVDLSTIVPLSTSGIDAIIRNELGDADATFFIDVAVGQFLHIRYELGNRSYGGVAQVMVLLTIGTRNLLTSIDVEQTTSGVRAGSSTTGWSYQQVRFDLRKSGSPDFGDCQVDVRGRALEVRFYLSAPSSGDLSGGDPHLRGVQLYAGNTDNDTDYGDQS